ncbi:sigma-70 family RNA polymerase sigma factor [Streptosporangium carneum]|uniref:RNA polymerase sigma factor n=1 Tax=Streptosporangium carneum TaxID=47481 RepID=A0A9W6I8P5_9ACTN|nr:sigma-70 family RNA polymerase sigma factor [Streptosporangium carneum]GLK14102.1 RNA polymerase sigma factor [Streptosporangium carneum]
MDREFSAFYRSTFRQLIAFLIKQGASVPIASDIAQDTMIKVYQRWTDIDQPKAWVHTVASRALVRKIADIHEHPHDQVPEPTSLLPCPDTVAEWETRHDALRVFRSLPPRQRQVLAWTYSGFTPSEIAQQLGMTPNVVSANLKKARRAAAAYFQAGEEEQ